MNREQNLELLLSVHEFPGPYIWKVIGRAENDFADRILEQFRTALELEFDPPHTVRETAAGRHIALTIETWMESGDDVLDLYTRLRETEGVVVLL